MDFIGKMLLFILWTIFCLFSKMFSLRLNMFAKECLFPYRLPIAFRFLNDVYFQIIFPQFDAFRNRNAHTLKTWRQDKRKANEGTQQKPYGFYHTQKCPKKLFYHIQNGSFRCVCITNNKFYAGGSPLPCQTCNVDVSFCVKYEHVNLK